MSDSSDKANEASVHEEFDPLSGSEETPSRPMPEEARDHEREEEVEEEGEPREEGYRTSYSPFIPILIWALLTGPLLVFNFKVRSLSPWFIGGWLVIAALIALLWRRGSNNTLRDRTPPLGWKSEIIPEMLMYLSLRNFDGMRFELNGEDDDDLEDHQVRWVMRYSKDRLRFAQLLILLACCSFAGMFVFPEITIPGSGAELATVIPIRGAWPIVSLLLAITSFFIYLDWDYGRLMVTNSYFYDLKENPAWLPWKEGKNNPYPTSSIWQVDPVDTKWGKLWGHGTVKIKIQEGMGGDMETLIYRRVPRHREFCKAFNSIVREQRGPDMGY